MTFSAVGGTDAIAASVGTADGTEPLWNGSANYDAISTAWTCPNYIPLARNIVYVIEYGENATLMVTGLNKISNDGYSVQGEPMATYAVGPRSFTSIEPLGKYTMYGGQMRARCKIITVRTGVGFRVVAGPILWYDYIGELNLADNNAAGGGESRGWAFEDTQTGNVTGDGNGDDGFTPTLVVTVWAGGEKCEVGWDLWIDGAQRCSADGVMH